MANKKLKAPVNIPVEKIHPFEGNPYKVLDNDEMNNLICSIQEQGVLTPIIIRPIENTDEYEVISGHRRLHATVKAGMKEVPAFIYAVTRDEAAIMLVDSNLHREHILPSERAFAYKLKMEAMNRQGYRSDLTCGQVGHKSRDGVSETESGRQVQRYIRLTYLIPELLDLVDEERIAFTPAVELSYLPHELQDKVVEIFERDEATPSYAQTVRFRRLLGEGKLTADTIEDIMAKPKANQKETVKFSYERIARFFPPEYSTKQMEDAIVRMLEERKQEIIRRRDDAERG